MTTGRAIDHIGITGHSLDALAAQYEALGFTLTPRAAHPDHMGTSNRLAQFAGQNFLELIEVDRPDGASPISDGVMSFGAYTQQFLARREGINLIVFQTQDRDADLARWNAAGLNVYEPFNFERLATLPDGSQQVVRFELGFVTHPDIDVLFFVCHNRAVEHFWKPAFQRHANGAMEIEAVSLVSDAPGPHAAFVASLFGGEIRDIPGGQSVACDAHRIDIVEPGALPGPRCIMDAPYAGAATAITIRAPDKAGIHTMPGDAGGTHIIWT